MADLNNCNTKLNIIDLTQVIDINTQVFPGSPNVNLLKWSNFETHRYVSEAIFCSTHVGTHIDAPFHFNKNGITVEKIPLERLVIDNNIKVIKVDKGENESIEVHDLYNHNINANDTILINTNWSKNNKLKKYFQTNPGLSEEAAIYLADKRINMIGIDSPSIDLAYNTEFNSHKVFSNNNILIIENLINLDKLLDNKHIKFIVLPLRLKDCSGSPVRALAIVEQC
jgi:kynurenine formamidase